MSSTTLLAPEFLRKLDNLSLRSRRVVRGTIRGERRSPALGRGVEFADYRSYQPGDDYRYIDWNIYSRLDRLFVKLFSEEEDINVHLLVDVSRSMAWGSPNKLDYAIRLAAAIGYIGLISLDRVGAVLFSGHPQEVLLPRRGRGQIFHLFEFLSGARGGGATTDLLGTMKDYVHQTKRRGLLVLVSDLLFPRGYEEGLKLARFHRFDVFVIHVLSDEELVPSLRGELRLLDTESRNAVEVTVDGPTLDAYARVRDSYFAATEAFCLRHQIDYLRTTTSIPYDDLLLRYLRIGGLIA